MILTLRKRVNIVKVTFPDPFIFEESEDTAVLLLHGFTGNSSDVRQLGRYLQKQGITSKGPHYEGHAEPPENILESSAYIWWKQVLEAYDALTEKGYKNIFAMGVSLGGVYALKLATKREVTGVVTICSPMYIKTETEMFEGFIKYAKAFKKREGKSPEEIEREIEGLTITSTLNEIREIIGDTKAHLDDVYVPTLVVQSRDDKVINPDSANIIYEGISSDDKDLLWLENSGHVPTIGEEKEFLFEKIYQFIQTHDI